MRAQWDAPEPPSPLPLKPETIWAPPGSVTLLSVLNGSAYRNEGRFALDAVPFDLAMARLGLDFPDVESAPPSAR